MTIEIQNARIQATLGASLLNTTGNASAEPAAQAMVSGSRAYDFGVAAGQMSLVWAVLDREILDAANDDINVQTFTGLDIGGGAGRDLLGAGPINWSLIGGIMVVNRASSTGSLVVGGEGSANAWNSLLNGSDTAKLAPLPPGGFFALSVPTGLAVGAGNNLLRLAASGGDLTYDLGLLGRT
jgi:hypothetical protein